MHNTAIPTLHTPERHLNTIQNASFITCIEENSYLMQNNDKNKKK